MFCNTYVIDTITVELNVVMLGNYETDISVGAQRVILFVE